VKYAAPVAVPALRTHGLSKDYGAGRGLFDLDLEIQPQEVFGYLGPNGAGKTTTIRCVMGMIRPTAGSAHVFGLDCLRDSVEVKRLVGYLPGDIPQFGGMRGKDVVAYFGGMRGGLDPKRIQGLAERLDLDLGRRFREYSSGNKQKLGIVLAFMHSPRFLILDEPTGGLDPLNQQEFYRLLAESREEGATVFLSSHILSEVEHVCDRVGILRSGHLVKVADLEELHRIRLHHVEIEFAEGAIIPEERIRAADGVDKVAVNERVLTCVMHGSFDSLLQALSGAAVENLISHEPSLEEVFLEFYRRDVGADALSIRP
jgi:ABC-2 type transport system ATP-binding protein